MDTRQNSHALKYKKIYRKCVEYSEKCCDEQLNRRPLDGLNCLAFAKRYYRDKLNYTEFDLLISKGRLGTYRILSDVEPAQ